jgi:uncharacterized delta-60 repeat protein
MRMRLRGALLAALAASGAAALASAAPTMAALPATDGRIDQTFAPGGSSTIRYPGLSGVDTTDAAVQADGKIVVAGDHFGDAVVLARYDPQTGRLDPQFGTDGTVVHDLSRNGDSTLVNRENVETVALQPDGKILIAGWAHVEGVVNRTFLVARYDQRGHPDPGFGDGGVVLTPLLTSAPAGTGSVQIDTAQGFGLALQPDGKIVVAGDGFRPADPLAGEPGFSDVTLARYLPDGRLDPAFGRGGVVARDSVGGSAAAVRLQADGRIVIAGRTASSGELLVARFMPDGSVDRRFGTGGTVSEGFAVSLPTAQARALAIQADGSIVATGDVEYRRSTAPSVRLRDAGVLVLTPEGRPATRFDGDGRRLVDLQNHRALRITGLVDNRPIAAAIAPRASSIVVAGSAVTDTDQVVGQLVRLTPSGALDTGFGRGGIVTTGAASRLEIEGLVAEPGGKLVAVGDLVRVGSRLQRYVQDSICTTISCLLPPLGPGLPR